MKRILIIIITLSFKSEVVQSFNWLISGKSYTRPKKTPTNPPERMPTNPRKAEIRFMGEGIRVLEIDRSLV